MLIKNRQMLIICHWVIVLLLLAVCSVRCHWRPLMPGAILSRGLDPVERSQSSPESTLLTNAGKCPPSSICIPTISCPDVLHLLKKAVKEPNLREQTIALVRIFFSSFHYCSFGLGEKKGVWGEIKERGLLPRHSCWVFPQQSSHGRLK